MKDKQPKEEHSQTPDILSPGASAVQANKKPKDSKKLKKESSDRRRKKWSLFRHFREATHIKKLQWIGSTVVVLTGIGVLGVYILDYIQRQEQFSVEHRPKVIVSRPPTLLSAFRCQVTDRAIHFFTGPMQAWVKNIKNEDAINAFVVGPQLQSNRKSPTHFAERLQMPSYG